MSSPEQGGNQPYEQYPGMGADPFPATGDTGSAARPPIPQSVTFAFYLMITGGVIYLIVPLLSLTQVDAARDQIREDNPDFSASDIDAAVNFGIGLVIAIGLIGMGLWFWMAFKNRAGRNWARITATVLFGLNGLWTFGTLTGGSVNGAEPAVMGIVLNVLIFCIGLGAITALWQKQSTAYFKPAPPAPMGYQPPYPSQ